MYWIYLLYSWTVCKFGVMIFAVRVLREKCGKFVDL